ncbi:MAG: FtsW/RodA/SpoVE family cell cycle protein [Chloroflexota bacterium]|nr:FtsW/RodA/SpoVE family cell cycle protein [Chloroflexota bacterium]
MLDARRFATSRRDLMQAGVTYPISVLLIGLGALFLLVNVTALSIIRPRADGSIWLIFGAWLLCVVIGELALTRILPRRDPLLFPLVMLLCGWGLIIIERVAPNFADRQAIWLVVGVAAMVITVYMRDLIALLRTLRYTLLFGGLLLLTATIAFGSNPSGIAGAPALWLEIGGLFVQPSEPLKIVLVVFLASYLAEQYTIMRTQRDRFGTAPSPRAFAPLVLMWGLSMVVLIWQRDLGTAALFFLVFLTLLYVASGRTLVLIGGGLLAVLGGTAAYLLFGVVRLRVDAWLNPWLEADGRAYQIVQSMMAVAAGGIFGRGIGGGLPTVIPVVHSDFIFAALAEEWGLIGVVAALLCLALIFMRGLRAAAALRPFPALLAVGLSALLAIQSLLIIGGVLKLIPLTGVTVPFMSYGGSSLVTNLIVVGLLLRLSSGDHARAVST